MTLLRPHPRTRLLLAAILLAVAAVAYSSWVLEILLPTRLSSVDGYASELFAADQPYRWVFGSLDILAGVCAVAAALLVLPQVAGPRTGRRPAHLGWARLGWVHLGWAALAVFGIATLLDVVFPLDCAPSLPACAALEEGGLASWRHNVHLVTSVIANAAAIAAIGALWLAARHRDAQPSHPSHPSHPTHPAEPARAAQPVQPVPPRRAGMLLFWTVLVLALATAALSLHGMRIAVPDVLAHGGQGVPQRLGVAMIAVWLAVAAASLHRAARAAGDDGRTGPQDARRPGGSGSGTWHAESGGRRANSSTSAESSSTSSGTGGAADRR
ncbi:DUF998 domain-containing protein [Yinghuangia soli]|uniref:DUF998 domain-containing protein n=1 Tax=Yinghuangia soli TaxID=2908204 RepID=A0AA41Q1L4_9ACTN|nr:DUF998 domain-containing protein [Yinghuangia soli]MCF2529848.1 DUF998 domain-containing protein [Yinghuangia soli]